MVREIYLHGALEHEFGRGPFRFQCDNIRELLAGMQMHHETFKRTLLQADDLCIAKVNGDRVTYVSPNELGFNFGKSTELHLETSKKGSYEGAAALALYFTTYGTAAYFIAAAVIYIAISAVISYAISSIMASLADTTETSEGKTAPNASNLFNAPENRVAQGGRVQLVFGQFRVGSYTISQSLEARRQAISISNSMSIIEGNTGSMNIFANDYGVLNPRVITWSFSGGTFAAGAMYTAPTIQVPHYEAVQAMIGSGDSGDWGTVIVISHYTSEPAYTLSVAANGDINLTSIGGSGGTKLLLTVACEDDRTEFSQTFGIEITPHYAPYDGSSSGGNSNGPGSSGPGGPGSGDGAGGVGSSGGSAGTGSGDGASA